MKKVKGKNTGLLPSSLKIISSCIKTVSTNASTVVRSAGASVAASIAASGDDQRDQVLWAGFDRLEIGPASFRHVLLLGYQNGFQVIDVEDASDFSELVSKRDGPVTFLQLLHIPAKCDGNEKFLSLHPLLVVVAGDEATMSALGQNRSYLVAPGRDGSNVAQSGASVDSPTAVRFYSFQSNCYVKVLRFRSTVFMVRCSPLIVAVGLEKEMHCIDAVTLENKFTVPTFPVPRFGGQGMVGVNFGYGPLALGPRWLAYASNKLLVSNSGRLSPKNLTPGISPSTSPSNGSLVARYAMESSKQLAAGIITLGDKGYKTFSKYYPEMLQDHPISSTPSNAGWKVSNASSEVNNAGMVIVKDVVSEAVISQFRAHSSPLCALCFDPSGTLLVTASIHGNNVNIFRIMPCTRSGGSSNQIHDWSSSHVLLYKLHRGITTAVIEDISFSQSCRWISIVSSKHTCHVFVLSPFGGDADCRTHGSQSQAINPVQSLPWWSTPSFVIDEQPFPPPSPLTLSVVGRLKNNSSGFLNSVSNAASSAVGKTHLPSGAVASVFHNSMTYRYQDVSTKVNSLEYLLVYTPSGYVIQYELMPSMGIQHGSRTQSVSHQPSQVEELGVTFESRQWWQVCRRSDSPEREESISVTSINCRESAMPTYNSRVNICMGGQKLVKSDSVKRNDRAHWFLSNAEVQINSGRLPVWQNAKVHFYVMRSVNGEGFAGGEAQIENIPCHEVEIRRKDLLPVFHHFNNIKSGWDDRAYSVRKNNSSLSLESGQCREKASDESVICLSKPASVSSTESSDGGSSRRIENLFDLDPVNCEKSSIPIGRIPNQLYLETRLSLVNRNPKEVSSELYNTATSQMDDHIGLKNPVDFDGCFQEGYCKVVEQVGHGKLTGAALDDDEHDGSHCGREISENDEEDELHGGMFDLFEEG
ncbi:autophagy-related protein 18g isoform X2 [Cynara cardunculus var. scolymus]|uniref:autophagy-related protein 18g isoform X2 n=1 Tax=Cynara cardunculus var. scolymus TaxID=59895 RepID=UPI000D629D52|nr:autophagy-related protein 18g isoform X2 [Cynara cardunculus var. scolymus]